MGASRRVGGDSRSHAAEDMSETTAAGVSGYTLARSATTGVRRRGDLVLPVGGPGVPLNRKLSRLLPGPGVSRGPTTSESGRPLASSAASVHRQAPSLLPKHRHRPTQEEMAPNAKA